MRQEKKLLTREITTKMHQHPAFVLLRYQNLSANLANEFRRRLDPLGGEFEVIRKRVLLKATLEMGLDIPLSDLSGHIGVVFLGQDPLETTKKVSQFGQENEKAVELLAGRFDGRLYSAKEVDMLSKLPGKNEMRAQLLSVFEAPLSGFVGLAQAVLTSVPYCLLNRVDQQSEVSGG